MPAELPPNPAEEKIDLTAAIEELDQSRAILVDKARRYTKFPIDRFKSELEISCYAMSEQFGTCVDAILELDAEEGEKKTTIINLMAQEDSVRVEAFNKLAGYPVCSLMNEAELEELREANLDPMDEDDDDFYEPEPGYFFIERYGSNSAYDLGQFIKYIHSNKTAKVLRAGNIAGKQVIDVTKIAAGVAVGIHLVRRFSR